MDTRAWARPSAWSGRRRWSSGAASTCSATSSASPQHALAEVRADSHRIADAASAAAARAASTACQRQWTPRCPGVVRSLQEGGAELLTFSQFPKRPGKTLRTTNVIGRLPEEFRRRLKPQGSPPTEDAARVRLFGLVVSGQIRLRRLDGWRHIPAVL